MKKVIGILAPKRNNLSDPFLEQIRIVCNYPRVVSEAGGIPIGILFSEGKFNKEIADMCDGFIITGGPDVESASINLIKYALEEKKPLLGICLGMQTMAGYEWLINKYGDLSYEEIDNIYKHEYEDEFLEYFDNHDKVDPFSIDDMELSKHVVNIDFSSRIYDLYGSSYKFPSLHKQIVKNIKLNEFKVTGYSEDGVIEVMESIGDTWIVGVQFHPELEKENLKLFKKLIDECK